MNMPRIIFIFSAIFILLGVDAYLGTVKGLIKLPALFAGAPVERPAAIIAQAVMAVLCVVFIALCVKSFIDARRGKKAW